MHHKLCMLRTVGRLYVLQYYSNLLTTPLLSSWRMVTRANGLKFWFNVPKWRRSSSNGWILLRITCAFLPKINSQGVVISGVYLELNISSPETWTWHELIFYTSTYILKKECWQGIPIFQFPCDLYGVQVLCRGRCGGWQQMAMSMAEHSKMRL